MRWGGVEWGGVGWSRVGEVGERGKLEWGGRDVGVGWDHIIVDGSACRFPVGYLKC